MFRTEEKQVGRLHRRPHMETPAATNSGMEGGMEGGKDSSPAQRQDVENNGRIDVGKTEKYDAQVSKSPAVPAVPPDFLDSRFVDISASVDVDGMVSLHVDLDTDNVAKIRRYRRCWSRPAPLEPA